jgi:hypothetical protein
MIRTEQHRESKAVCRCIDAALFELSQSEVQKQIPDLQAKRPGDAILFDFPDLVANHPKGKSEMIMHKRVGRMRAHDKDVPTNRLGVVFDAKIIVGVYVTDLRFVFGCGRYAGRPDQKQRCNRCKNYWHR